MKHFRVEIKICGRSKKSGRRSCAKDAAYRSATVLLDAYTGRFHDYSGKEGVEATGLTGWVLQDGETYSGAQQRLWWVVDHVETRKDARTHVEIIISLPNELTRDQMIELAHEITRRLREKYGIVLDWALHSPPALYTDTPAHSSDPRNWHLHVGGTLRRVDDFGHFHEKVVELEKRAAFYWIRRMVAEVENQHLSLAGHTIRVDHRSHRDQFAATNKTRAEAGLPLVATPLPRIHLGESATRRERRGELTRIGRRNRDIREVNEVIGRYNHRRHVQGVHILGDQILTEFRRRDPERDYMHGSRLALHLAWLQLAGPIAEPDRVSVCTPEPSLEAEYAAALTDYQTAREMHRRADEESRSISLRLRQHDAAAEKWNQGMTAAEAIIRNLWPESEASGRRISLAENEQYWTHLLEHLQNERQSLLREIDTPQPAWTSALSWIGLGNAEIELRNNKERVENLEQLMLALRTAWDARKQMLQIPDERAYRARVQVHAPEVSRSAQEVQVIRKRLDDLELRISTEHGRGGLSR